MIFRQGTAKDLNEFYGGPPIYSMRALVAELDGKVIAVAGTYRAKDQMYAFSEMKDEMRRRKRDILRMAKLVLPMLDRHRQLIAHASKTEKSSARFLEWLGFEYVAPAEHGDIYLWHGLKQREQ